MFKNDSGLLLVDLLLAVAIVGIAAVAIIEILTVSLRAGKANENIQIAANLCRERMEQIRNIPVLTPGTGSNSGDAFLPDLGSVSVTSYFSGFYLTESDTYKASDSTSGSLSGMTPPRRIDRITQIEWVDDPDGGSSQDYFKVTVTVFWRESGDIKSISLETNISSN